MGRRTLALSALLAPGIAVGALSCDHDLPFLEFEELQPRGVIEGQVLYQGPPPCTENGHVLGAAVLYLFDSNGLPPPDGLAPSVENFSAVAGDLLFADHVKNLQFNANGDRWCPAQNAQKINASANFVISPVTAGSYQIRAFYDLDGDYFPAFDYSNLATKGDINGGALHNLDTYFAGQERPDYKDIEVGTAVNGEYTMPSKGVHLQNVTVGLGQPYTLQRPYMHYAGVIDEQYGNTDPNNIVMPADYWGADFSLTGIESSLLRVVFNEGVPDAEKAEATASPFNFHVDDPGTLMIYRFDFNGDGSIGEGDSIPESTLVPALMPLMIWQKEGQSNPTVVNLGITFADDSLFASAGFTSEEPVPYDHITVALRPATICIDSSVSPSNVALVTPYPMDQTGENSLFGENVDPIKAALAGLTGTVPESVEVIYSCMPPGNYGLNAIYTSGQVWMIPNESGYCTAREEPKDFDADGMPRICGSRPRLPSQDVTVQIGTTVHGVDHCYEFESNAMRERFRQNCLNAEERVLFDAQTLY